MREGGREGGRNKMSKLTRKGRIQRDERRIESHIRQWHTPFVGDTDVSSELIQSVIGPFTLHVALYKGSVHSHSTNTYENAQHVTQAREGYCALLA